ncbi:acyl dehydratase [Neomicrococcus aestuarii]|uniref:Acyl dehydratase n=1 Tax=Neomicrococcus aestuarii TaxID=556325 RepID=A0A7W8TTN4_9MICC|nr:MaoC/PaaZ C-terminal domain-containing protein [Neomicrococcus aestuarii]MBB5511870.1 acyl dehydratase [Neomicrococcus aestuarii]
MAILSTMPSVPKLYAQAAAQGIGGSLKGALVKAFVPKNPLNRTPVVKPPVSAESAGVVLPEEKFTVQNHRVDREALVKYQRVMKDTVRDELPSVFLHAQTFPVALHAMSQPEFPLPLMGLVHLANEVDHRRTVRPDEELTVTAWTENPRAHFAGIQFNAVAEIAVGEDVVWRGVSTYLVKGQFLLGNPERPEREEIDLASQRATALWSLGAETGREYAAVSGDFNPIHLSSASAKVAGMKGAIAHGMYSAGRALAATAPHFEAYQWSITFEQPVFLPAKVSFESHAASDEPGKSEFSGWNSKKQRRHFVGWIARR